MSLSGRKDFLSSKERYCALLMGSTSFQRVMRSNSHRQPRSLAGSLVGALFSLIFTEKRSLRQSELINFVIFKSFIMWLYSSSDSQLQYRSSKLYHVLFFRRRPWALRESVQVEMWCRGTVSYSAASQPSTGWAFHTGISTRQLDLAHCTRSSKAVWLNRRLRRHLFP